MISSLFIVLYVNFELFFSMNIVLHMPIFIFHLLFYCPLIHYHKVLLQLFTVSSHAIILNNFLPSANFLTSPYKLYFQVM